MAGAGSNEGVAEPDTELTESPEIDRAPLVTDRPGNGNAASTVPRWALQVEASGAYLYDSQDAATTHLLSFPTWVRFGLFERLELRLGSSLLGVDLSAPQATSTDTSVGIKVQLLRQTGATPDLALMTDVFLPTGGDGFTAGVVVPEARAAAAWSLPAGFGLLVNAGASVPKDDAGWYPEGIYVVNLSYVLPALEQRLSVFVESYGRIPAGAREALIQFDAGAAFLLSDDWQVDLFTQHGLLEVAPDFQASVGLSARFWSLAPSH